MIDLAARAHREVETLDRELAEIEMLVTQATSEAGRHEAKRAQVAEKLAALGAERSPDPKELAELNAQLLLLTKRAAVMEAQVDVLTGKQRVVTRFREALAGYAAEMEAGATGGSAGSPAGSTALVPTEGASPEAGSPEAGSPEAGSPETPGSGRQTGVSRLVLDAQEDLRREIARAMHDGPAQSLTNIVLQAQIVDRLVARDPEKAKTEVGELMAMVQATLDATKTFIFDVRPMVLDDLGLVPTLRRMARDRGRQSQIPVEFESMGADRRLTVELESALFRMLEEALAGYLAGRPDRVTLRLDWSDLLDARIAALRDERPAEELPAAPEKPSKGKGRFKGGDKPTEELPAALAEMIEDQRAVAASAAEAAHAPVTLPDATWREIRERAAAVGITAELLDGGTELRLVVELPAAG